MNANLYLSQEDSMTTTTCRKARNGKPRAPRGRIAVRASILLVLLALGAVRMGASQAVPPLPKAESLFDSFVEKAGGRAMFEKIANRRAKAVLKMSVMPDPGEVTSTVTKAGPYRVVVDTKAIGRIEYGCDGPVVWEINPVSGPRILEGSEAQRLRFLNGLDLPMRWRDIYKRVECTGLATVADRPAFKVLAVSREDYPVTYYFDQASGLLAKIEYPMVTIVGQGLQEIFLGDYRTVNGALFPFLQVRKESGREMALTFTSVEYNVDIPADLLTLPEAISKINRGGK
jgi:hypothetical protein